MQALCQVGRRYHLDLALSQRLQALHLQLQAAVTQRGDVFPCAREALVALLIYPRTPPVHFVGGKPFVHLPLVLEGVEIAAELGIPCYVETGTGWCTYRVEIVERFVALRGTGA
jgi:pyruvate-formate lyase-activating enzyme